MKHYRSRTSKFLFSTISLLLLITACSGGSDKKPLPYLEYFVGSVASAGNIDGQGLAASFNLPTGVAVDSSGNTYVADRLSHTIRKISSSGAVSTLAGTAGSSGSTDATGTAARFNTPYSVATDSAGNIYVADTGNNTIRKITPQGVVTTIAGTAGTTGSVDDAGAAASFNGPRGIAVDTTGNIYVADTGNSTVRKISPAGLVVTLAGSAGLAGGANATGSAARFNSPYGLTVDSTGNVYVADTAANTVRQITSAGVVTTLAGTYGVTGSVDATGAAASFNSPTSIAVDGSGNLYVADSFNHVVRKITSAGVVTTLAGTAGAYGSTNATGPAARLYYPSGIGLDSAGVLYIADTGNSTIRKISTALEATTFAGSPAATGSADATGSLAGFNGPRGLASDSSGNLYAADTNNHTIRKITSVGVVSTIAGTAGVSGSTNATGAAASFSFPRGLTTDSAGNVYVTDRANHTIRKITPLGVVTTLAGSAGIPNSTNGTGTAARFNFPEGIVADSSGNLYVADTLNFLIRKITPAGAVTTLAGTAGVAGSTDGTGTAASFTYPVGITIDSLGNLYVSEQTLHTIRKITPAGVVSTFAGSSGVSGNADGINTAARFNTPESLTVDSADNVYVADTANNMIRKLTPDGAVTTIVGEAGKAGFKAGPIPGSLSAPHGIHLIGQSLYISTENGIAVLK